MGKKGKLKQNKESNRKNNAPVPSVFSQFRRGSSSEKLSLLSTISSLDHPRVIPFLSDAAHKNEDNIEINIKAAQLLEELEKPIDRDFFDSLVLSKDIQLKFIAFLETSSQEQREAENIDTIIDKYLSLEPFLQKILQKQLIADFSEKSLEIISSMIGKEKGLDGIIAEVLGNFSHQGAADILVNMLNTGDKAVRKEVKKAIFRLEKKGISPNTKFENGASVLRRPSSSEPKGFLSAVDGIGNQCVWLVIPSISRGQYLFFAIINEVKGIINFNGGETTRKGAREYFENISDQENIILVEADSSYCQFLIEEGYENASKSDGRLPREYLPWRKFITKEFSEKPQPLIYRFFQADEMKSNRFLVDNMGKLEGVSELQGWFLEKGELEKHLPAIREARESKILINETQKQSRYEEIMKQITNEIFDENKRHVYKKRLEEMSYFFMKLGREEDAKLSFVAALELDDSPPATHPFLRHLVEKSVTFFVKEEKRQEKENVPLIIKP